MALLHNGRVPIDTNFIIVLRGYDPAEVDAAVRRVQQALMSVSPEVRASVRDELRRSVFRVRIRGYDRGEVDEYVRRATDDLG